jgi:hypothetical protein
MKHKKPSFEPHIIHMGVRHQSRALRGFSENKRKPLFIK